MQVILLKWFLCVLFINMACRSLMSQKKSLSDSVINFFKGKCSGLETFSIFYWIITESYLSCQVCLTCLDLNPWVFSFLPLWFSPPSCWWGSDWAAGWGSAARWGQPATACLSSLPFPPAEMCCSWWGLPIHRPFLLSLPFLPASHHCTFPLGHKVTSVLCK